jgi:hypothetical protein
MSLPYCETKSNQHLQGNKNINYNNNHNNQSVSSYTGKNAKNNVGISNANNNYNHNIHFENSVKNVNENNELSPISQGKMDGEKKINSILNFFSFYNHSIIFTL